MINFYTTARISVFASCLGVMPMAAPLWTPPKACLAQPGTAQPTKIDRHNDQDEKSISEETLRQELVGKRMYLRNGYLGNTLRFNEQGLLIGSAPKVSYTLSLMQIERVHLSSHRLEIEAIRYGVHFLDEGSSEDALANADKVRITPKKKVVTITVDRARVEKQKKIKEPRHKKEKEGGSPSAPGAPSSDLGSEASSQRSVPPRQGLTQANANLELRSAIQTIFSAGLDERMIASLPDYWRSYFENIARKTEYRPADASILRSSEADRKARLISNIQSPSNDYAQAAGVAGIAQYHVVVGPDGRASEVSVGRPIGFGLDENAVASIRKATFEPAMKDGKPVAVLLDVVVQFRIYSKRTAMESPSVANEDSGKPAPLPGPYSTPPAAGVPK